MKLTKETFLNLTPPETTIKRTPITGYSGLYLEQNKTGFTFQFNFKSPVTGKYRFLKLTRFKYGDVINKKMLDNIANQLVINQGEVIKGIDPLIKKASAAPARLPAGKSINKIFDTFTETHHFKQLAASTQGHYISNYNGYLAEYWGKQFVTNITRTDVVTFLNQIESDAVYNQAKTNLQAIESQALDMGILEIPFMFKIKRRPTGTRTKTLTEKEIIALMVSTSGWDSLRNICKAQLLYGCRNGEVAGAKWEEINLKANTWTIPAERIKTEKAFKRMERPHILPLLPKMSKVLLEQREHGTTGLIFPQQKHFKNSTYYKPQNSSRWLKLELGIGKGTHQLRHTCATRMANMPGITELDIKIMLNHTVSGNTQKYVNTQYLDRKLELFTKWHSYLDELAKKGELKCT